MKIKLLTLSLFLITGLFLAFNVKANTSWTCVTDALQNGSGCNSYDDKSWCGGGQSLIFTNGGLSCTSNEPEDTSCTGGKSFSCATCSCVCPANTSDCGGTCTSNDLNKPLNCSNWNTCTQVCGGCSSGVLCDNQCMANTCQSYQTASCVNNAVSCSGSKPTLKLGWNSVINSNTGVPVLQAANPALYILDDGFIGMGTSTPGANLSLTGGNMFVNDYLITDLTTKAVITRGWLKSYIDNTFLPSLSLGGTWATTTGGIYNLDKVGVGTSTLVSALTVSGDLTVFGDISLPNSKITVNKLNVNTIDPLYDIFGLKYSTFVASVVGGVKEEVTGKIKINKKVGSEYQVVIDFDKEKKGSDLWVWRKVIDFNKDNTEVLITPYGKFANTYYLINGNSIIFKSNTPVEVSYRLLAKRFDWRDWPTFAKDQSEKAGLFIK